MFKTKVVFLSLIVVVLSSCVADKGNRLPQVAVTILPQKYLLDKIVGDSIQVVCAIPQGGNPEEYATTPRQMKEIATSSLYFKVGELGFEKTTLPAIVKNISNIKVVDLSEGLDFITSECSHGGEEHSHSDPHYWTSPKGAKLMATNLYNAIVAFDNKNASYYTSNYMQLIHQLEALDREVNSILSAAQCRHFAIFHPSLSYFARDYNLQQLSLEESGKEMTPQRMQQVIEEAIEKGIKTVFIQNEFTPEQVKTFAQEIEASVVVINPLAYNFIEEIREIAYAISK
ncbi:MAG: zinc ABC transporter substrate-binding protein [Bacteroidales bacterium]|nr:zinc ABC transporter substrate-binding protein [Bacteroidales bacterium]